MTIGGNVCVRNGARLDYCWKQAVQSLMPVCDEVVICDGESTDGTTEEIKEWCAREPKLRLVTYPWPNPKGDPHFWTTWLNTAREHLRTDYHLQLDADEILHESAYPTLEILKTREGRFAVWFKRYNFWADVNHLIPHGYCCSHRVVRLAPQNVWLPSDGQDERAAEVMGMAEKFGQMEIFHYGFLRKPGPFLQKNREILQMFFNGRDERMDRILDEPNWMTERQWFDKPLLEFNGQHPKIALDWLRERGRIQ